MEKAPHSKNFSSRHHPDWYQLYESSIETQLPWYFPEVDPDIRKEVGRIKRPQRCQVLDIGCGLGNQSALLSELGFQVTGSDVSIPAILRARSLHPETTYVLDDITESALPPQTFDLINDRGCFHILDPKDTAKYLTSIERLMRPKARFFLKVLSTEQGDYDSGPLRFSIARLHEIFSPKFEILKMQRTVYHGQMKHPPKAWFSVMRLKKENQ